MDDTNRRCGVTRISQDLSKVPLASVQVPREVSVAKPHDSVGVRPPSREDRGPRGTASRSRAETPRETHPLCRQIVEVRRLHSLHAITVQELAEVMTVDQKDVGPRIGGTNHGIRKQGHQNDAKSGGHHASSTRPHTYPPVYRRSPGTTASATGVLLGHVGAGRVASSLSSTDCHALAENLDAAAR